MTDEKKENGGEPQGFFLKLAQNDAYRKVVVAAGLLGILLIALSGSLKSCGTQSAQSASSAGEKTDALTAEQYESALEQNLTRILSEVRGTGNVSVLVTLDQTSKKVYATQEKTSDQQTSESEEGGAAKQETNESGETTYLVTKDADGTEHALPVTEIQPLVKGVVVVCGGGGDPEVQKSVTDAVTTALHISSMRVCVIQSKS